MVVASLSPIEAPNCAVTVPGSKSLTNRALVCAALADGESRLVGALDSDDTQAMRAGLARLGVEITEDQGDLRIHGIGGRFAIPMHPIDCQASGTTMRFLTACAALAPGRVVLDGTARMRERPIQPLADALNQLGANVKTVAGCPPVTVQGGSLEAERVTIDATQSSQFLSALLMVAPFAKSDFELIASNPTSRPYIEMTLDVMKAFGVSIPTRDLSHFDINTRQSYRSRTYVVEADASSATYFFAAAAITGGRIKVEGLSPASSQADVRFVEVLQSMGCTVERSSDWISVRGPKYLHGIDVDLNAMPDAALTLAVASCFAQGPTKIRNVPNLRLKETDRMAALQNELQKLGAKVSIEGDDLLIEPPSEVQPARIATYDDHRMAMSFAVAGLRVEGVEIEDPDCVAKTFPDFFERMKALSSD